MLGLFSTLNLGTRSLQAQQAAIEVAGQNLANVNNTAYARQRVSIQTSPTVDSAYGPQGTGAQATAIRQLRDTLVDGQIRSEQSVGGYWQSAQTNLQKVQVSLGEFIDSTVDVDESSGMADDLSGLFGAFQAATTSSDPNTARKALVNDASALALRMNQTSQRLTDLNTAMNKSVTTDVDSANSLLSDVAQLNDQIRVAELSGRGAANELRDMRQEKLESLAKLTNIETVENSNGTVDVSISGHQMISGPNLQDKLQAYDSGNGQMLVRTANAGTSVNLSGGSLQGTINVRDGALKDLREGLDTLASTIITEVNNLHRAGYSLTGSTGEDFFTGTKASDIGVNSTLKNNLNLIQLSDTAGESGNKKVALALAQLASKTQPGLNNQTISGAYGSLVSSVGQELNTANSQITSHAAVTTMLQRQRDAVSGVSIDEEMSDLTRFQRAYEASARIISTVDQMIQTVLNMKQ